MTSISTIRPLVLAEVQTLLDWAAAEGWNPGLEDAAAFHAADPQGFIGCFVDGQLAAGLSAVRYGDDFGFIGLYIAHADFRGKGYGRQVWDAGLHHLEDRTIGLDGVPEQQANYRRMGFTPAYETYRWSGAIDGAADPAVMTVTADHLPALHAYDSKIFPRERTAFLSRWLQPPRTGKLIIRSGGIAGYAICRQCHDGWKIGPLFADRPGDAVLLLQACAAAANGPVHIDVPDMQGEFASVLKGLGFSRGFSTARMYRGRQPDVPMEQVFGITTLELG